MNTTNVTSMEIRKLNQNQVYQAIYHHKQVSKQFLAMELHMSMPTITQHLLELQEAGLIEKVGSFDSTGGRRAQILGISPLARVSIGVEVLSDCAHILALDLYGTAIARSIFHEPYRNTPAYYASLGQWIAQFGTSLPVEETRILGVGIAVQGLVSAEEQVVTFGHILDNLGVSVEDFSRHIPWPCYMQHDSECAAMAEVWFHPQVQDAIYIALNYHLGGALVHHRQLHRSGSTASGVFEHMLLYPGGAPCYCGKRGCWEAYCSIGSLLGTANLSLDVFFLKLRDGDPEIQQLWDQFLYHCALGIENIRMVYRSDVILGGQLRPYLTDSDFETLRQKLAALNIFPRDSLTLIPGSCGDQAPAIGAALHYITEFITHVGLEQTSRQGGTP